MNIFNQIQIKKPKSNLFDLSHERKLSFNMGELVPIMLEEIVPGDNFKVSSEIFIRLAPMLAPIMHRVNVYTHYFFVPNRIVWDDWKSFITGGEDGTDTHVFPRLTISESRKTDFNKGKLSDYFGIPITDGATIATDAQYISALPYRAYAEIWNEYYRDQTLQEKIEYSKASGLLDATEQLKLINIQTRAWEKDYFTSALPWPQRGADVTLPVQFNYKDSSEVFQAGGGAASGALTASTPTNDLLADGVNARIENLEENATSVTINELRNATRLQEWLEKNARAGSRYIEQILSHFGVKSSDARLQRPEYLGGGKNPVVISEVLNQAGEGPTGTQASLAPVGEMYGHGVSVGKNNAFRKSFEEHGYIIGIMSVLPRTTYQQGIERLWSKTDKLDYYWPEFAHLGEQEILNKELYLNWDSISDGNNTFGYTPRYAEYKYKQSTVHGDFRDNLKYWHMGRTFDDAPALNEDFIKSDPTHDIFAVTDPTIDKLYCQVYNKVKAIRPMPYYGTPYL